MRHVFRKYLSNRGSALFMVISTMTALMVSCMAMYFSMVSARATQYAVFNQIQASQSAQSIADIILNCIADPANHGEGGGVLLQSLKDLNVGESITTDANGFKSLDPSVATGEDQSQLGAYAVTITRLEDVNGDKQFDIMVMSSVGGNRDAVHLMIGYNEEENPDFIGGGDGSGGDSELFAASGYIPNDAYINGGYYLTNVFYDTQFTYMGTFASAGNNRIAQNLSTGGDFMMSGNAMGVLNDNGDRDSIKKADLDKIGPVTWAIRGNFYPSIGNDFKMRGGSQILVGGDLTFNSGNNFFQIENNGYYKAATNPLPDHICVYVNGDLNYNPSPSKQNVWFFVNGNVNGFTDNPLSANSRIYVTGTAAERAAKTSSLQPAVKNAVREWPKSGAFADGMSYDESMALLGQKTQTIDYYKWDLSKNTENGQHIDIRINATDSDWTDDKNKIYGANESTYIIAYDKNVDSAKYIKSNGGKENGVIGNSFVIDSVWTHGDNNHSQTILIDTGDDPTNIMTIKLSGVCGDNGDEFSWFVDEEEIYWPVHKKTFGAPMGDINGNNMRHVLIRGRGIVLIDLPKGVTYQNSGYTLTSHMGWWFVQGGTVETRADGHLNFTGVKGQDASSYKIVPYIHKTCEPGDGCVFSTSTSTVKCNECGGALTAVSCTIHGNVNKYCAACHPEKTSRTDWCANHVDNVEFAKFYNTSPKMTADNKKWVTDKDGKIVYPNTNFMVVSCEESAEMRFAGLKDGTKFKNSPFFGFIYAPYMSYIANGEDSGEGFIRLCGGMTVGDYELSGFNSFIGCYPDKMPNEIAGMTGGGSMSGGKLSGTTKSWKITVGGYK